MWPERVSTTLPTQSAHELDACHSGKSCLDPESAGNGRVKKSYCEGQQENSENVLAQTFSEVKE